VGQRGAEGGWRRCRRGAKEKEAPLGVPRVFASAGGAGGKAPSLNGRLLFILQAFHRRFDWRLSVKWNAHRPY
jgi:hypothetical protein